MENEVATTGGFPSVMNAADLSTALATSQVQETQNTGGLDFLKMDFDTGEFSCGIDQDDVTDEIVIINTSSIQHGWMLWTSGPPKKIFVAFTQPLPIEIEAIEITVKGKPQMKYAEEARAVQGAFTDDGSMFCYETNTYGGKKCIDTLLGKIKAHAAEGSQHLYPKVKFTSENYPGAGERSGKTNYNPVFEIVAWCDGDGNEEGEKAAQVEDKTSEAAPEEKTEEAPKRQRRKRKSAA